MPGHVEVINKQYAKLQEIFKVVIIVSPRMTLSVVNSRSSHGGPEIWIGTQNLYYTAIKHFAN